MTVFAEAVELDRPGARSAARPVRLTVVMSHPVQYMTPLFQHLAEERPEVELTVVYATIPTPGQQGSGFGVSFAWDVPLLVGHRWRVSRPPRRSDDYQRFLGIDDPRLPDLVLDTRPDAVLVGGWQFAAMLRVVLACRRAGVPVLYRGDTSLLQAPSGLRGRLWERRTRALLALFDAHLVVGTRAREYLERFVEPPRRLFSSPHCVEVSRFRSPDDPREREAARAAARRDLGLAPTAYVVAFVGKLEAIKRPLDLVRAAARMRRRPTLLMVGAGPLEQDCRDEASRARVDVAWTGFVNQGRLASVYLAADVVVLPSASETWGLVVNEAMAAGVPCVVSDRVGCARDLVRPGLTGDVYPVGDVDALAASLDRVGDLLAGGHDFAAACHERAAAHAPAAAAAGIVEAALAVTPPRDAAAAHRSSARGLAPLGEVVTLGGLERMVFEVFRTLRSAGAQVHCLLNQGERDFDASVVEDFGATWSPATPRVELSAACLKSPRRLARATAGICRSSAHTLAQVVQTRATHVFSPTHLDVVRRAPALAVARALGVRSVLRLGTAPGQGPFQAAVWRYLVDPFVDEFVCNSSFTQRELLATGVSSRKSRVIYNCLPERGRSSEAPSAPPASGRRLVYVGQTIPEKGLLELLEAFAAAGSQAPDLTLDVLGKMSGWEHPAYRGFRAALVRRAEAPGLAGRVRFLGFRDDVPALLAGAAALCCPSTVRVREGFGVVVLEAKAAGVPALVTPSGALPELVRDGVDGWLCADDTPQALEAGLRRLLATPPATLRAMGESARIDAERRFTRRAFDDSWVQVFAPVRQAPLATRWLPARALPVAAMVERLTTRARP